MVALLHNPMRLVPVEADERDGDRRVFQRRAAQGTVIARRLDHALPSRRHPQLALDLCDLSVGGLSAISDLPINPGERVNIDLRADDIPPFNACARVVRCEMSGMGYRVAVAFEALPLAA